MVEFYSTFCPTFMLILKVKASISFENGTRERQRNRLWNNQSEDKYK